MSEINPLLYFDTPQSTIDALIAFAQNQPAISRLTLFGSRVTGKRREKQNRSDIPDLDVAYELDEAVWKVLSETPLHALFQQKEWQLTLNAKTGVDIELHYLGSEAVTVGAYVVAGHIVIYNK